VIVGNRSGSRFSLCRHRSGHPDSRYSGLTSRRTVLAGLDCREPVDAFLGAECWRFRSRKVFSILRVGEPVRHHSRFRRRLLGRIFVDLGRDPPSPIPPVAEGASGTGSRGLGSPRGRSSSTADWPPHDRIERALEETSEGDLVRRSRARRIAFFCLFAYTVVRKLRTEAARSGRHGRS